VSGRRPVRRSHSSARGTTLIELLVTLAVLAIGFVALLSAFAQTEVAVGSTADDAQLVSRARAVADFIQSESFTYAPCASPSMYEVTLDQSWLYGAKPQLWTKSDVIATVAQATGGTHTVAGVPNLPLAPIAGGTCGRSVFDYGVQQITFTLRSQSGHTLTRVVYKRWN